MKIHQLIINGLALLAIGLMLVQRIFMAITSPIVDAVLIGSSCLCIILGIVVHKIFSSNSENSLGANINASEEIVAKKEDSLPES